MRHLFRKAAPRLFCHVQACAYEPESGPLLFELEFKVSDVQQCMKKLGLPKNAYAILQTA